MEARPTADGVQVPSASWGISAWQPGDTDDDLLGRADAALYRAKAAGRDRVEAS